MPGLVSGRKRRADVPDTPDETSDSDPSSDEGIQSRSANKRARTNGHQPAASDRPVLPASYASNPSTYPNGTDQPQPHQPGSLVRVSLKDFVTYSEAEFLLGPSLNMIIGPNGTGKSTLVCAICLGLGWKTEHLGRAKDVGEFVKHGATEAEVEIELARDPARHDSNPVIRMNIKKSTGKASFFLNNRAVPRKRILEECKAFSIQIDNLCQFLPQDRVVEFAALHPIDMLAQTQRAAAPQEMSDMHEQLKELHRGQKTSKSEQVTLTVNLKNLEDRQNLQRTDVERIQQRSHLQREIRALELYKPKVELRASREHFEDCKTKKLAAMQDLAKLESEVEPVLRALGDKKDYRDGIDAVAQQRTRLLKRSEENAETLLQKQTTISDQIKERTQQVEAEKTRVKTLEAERARIETKIRNVQVQMEAEAPEFDAADYNEKIRAVQRDMRDLEDKAREANDLQTTCVNDIRTRKQRIDEKKRDIQALHSHAGQQGNKLRKASQDTFKAWDWIQKNREVFTGPVFGPPIISCSVKDQRHAALVESVFAAGDMLAITVTNKTDFNLLQQKLTGELRLADIYPRSSSQPLSYYRHPVPKENLADLGLDAYLSDLMEGPDEVLGMLCDNRNMHKTAVAFNNLSTEQYNRLASSPIDSFVTPQEIYTITRRREYGDRGTSTRTRKLKQAQYFTDQPIDTAKEQELTRDVRELEGEISELEEQARDHQATSRQYGPRHDELKEAKAELQNEKDMRQQAMALYNALPTQLSSAKDKLQDAQDKIASSEQAREALIAENDRDMLTKGQDAIMFAANMQALQKSHKELFEAQILLIEAQSDLETLEARNGEVRASLAARKEEVETLRGTQAQAKAAATRLIAKVAEINGNLTDEEKEMHDRQSDTVSVEELANNIEALQARLEMVHEGNPNVMREYEERGQKIERAKEKLARVRQEMEDCEANMSTMRGRWEPRLDSLMQEISDAFGDNFERIGCAGQVQVDKTEDFAEWSIKIMVKFREHEQMSVLDNHRQSGGERAVSTIFYLMALQSLARAPFRVVDEINQGMDPRNERLVHSRMVSIACAEQTSQYFLITPKLLPNLEYHPKMKIHCIASGEYMPQDHRQLDFQALAKKALSVRRSIAAG